MEASTYQMCDHTARMRSDGGSPIANMGGDSTLSAQNRRVIQEAQTGRMDQTMSIGVQHSGSWAAQRTPDGRTRTCRLPDSWQLCAEFSILVFQS